MKKIYQFLQKLFNKSKYYIQKYVEPSVETVELLKAAINSPAVSLLTAIIPGTVDDVIVNRIKVYLPKVLIVLGYAECFMQKENNSIVQCAIEKLRSLDKEGQHAAYHNIASLLSQYLSDGKLTWSESLHLAEITFIQKFKKAA